VVTEREPAVVALPAAAVECLVAQQRGRVEVTPAPGRGRYRLVARGVAGVLVLPGCRLVIRPKMPLRNLFFLLDPVVELPAESDHVRPDRDHAVLDFLAALLAQRMRERAAAGLRRSYVEQVEQGRVLRGRLDHAAQVRRGPVHKEQLHSRHEELTADVPCQQVPRALAERLLGMVDLDVHVRSLLRQAVLEYAEVTPRSWPADELARLAADADADDRPLLELCGLLAEGLAPAEAEGQAPAPSFLLDMERVFERYLTRGVVEAFVGRSRWQVRAQPQCVVSRLTAGQPELTMRPDILIERDGRGVLLVDAKWKRLRGVPRVTTDLYQVLGYGTALGVGQVVLVYPGRRDRVWTYDLQVAPVRVEVRTLRVTATPERCRRSLVRLGRTLVGQA
jgi:5-methylcytosine-specific restriction enzyme subunit McrC